MLLGPMAEKQELIRIPDVNPQAFNHVLNFIYTENLGLPSCDKCDVQLLLFGVYYAAHKYMLLELERLSSQLLCLYIRTKNVCVAYEFALQMNIPELEERCLNVLREDLVEVMQLEGFREIRHSTLLTIVRQENLLISESSLVLGAMMWAHTECNRQDIKPTPRAMRQMLGPAFTEFRFLAMSAEEFSKNFILTTLLSTTEKIAILANVSKADEIKLPDIFCKIEYPRSLPITPKPIVKFGYEVNNCSKNAFDVTKTKKLQCCNTFEVSYDILLTGFVFPTGSMKRKREGEDRVCKAQITVVLQDKDFKLIDTITLDEEVAVGTSLCPRYHPPIIISKNCTYRISAVIESPGHYEKWAGNDFADSLRVFTKINAAANPEPCFIKAIRYLKL